MQWFSQKPKLKGQQNEDDNEEEDEEEEEENDKKEEEEEEKEGLFGVALLCLRGNNMEPSQHSLLCIRRKIYGTNAPGFTVWMAHARVYSWRRVNNQTY